MGKKPQKFRNYWQIKSIEVRLIVGYIDTNNLVQSMLNGNLADQKLAVQNNAFLMWKKDLIPTLLERVYERWPKISEVIVKRSSEYSVLIYIKNAIEKLVFRVWKRIKRQHEKVVANGSGRILIVAKQKDSCLPMKKYLPGMVFWIQKMTLFGPMIDPMLMNAADYI